MLLGPFVGIVSTGALVGALGVSAAMGVLGGVVVLVAMWRHHSASRTAAPGLVPEVVG